MRPIRLYLDTSDYAVMYSAKPDTDEASICAELRKLVASGRIEIGISYHVAFEFLQPAIQDFRQDRIARATLLKELCGTNAFPYPTDIGQGYGFNSDGLWMPKIDIDDVEIENVVRKLAISVANQIAFKPEGRKALAARKVLVKFATNAPSEFRRLAAEYWPLEFEQSFIEDGSLSLYLMGQISRADANRRIRFHIADPVAAYSTWYELYGKDNPVARPRDLIAAQLEELLKGLKKMLDEHAALEKDIDGLLAGDHALDEEIIAKLASAKHEARIGREELSTPAKLGTDPVWTARFGSEGARIAAEIFFGLYRQKRDIRRSDAVDLIHAMYLPLTDLWRGDKAFSHMLITNRVHLHERVVPTLRDLPARIAAHA